MNGGFWLLLLAVFVLYLGASGRGPAVYEAAFGAPRAPGPAQNPAFYTPPPRNYVEAPA